MLRRSGLPLAAALCLTAASVALSAPALAQGAPTPTPPVVQETDQQAPDPNAPRVWVNFQADEVGTWFQAEKTPAKKVPGDGQVEGWRFALGRPDGKFTEVPSTTDGFQEICGKTKAESGKKRVALVIDAGHQQDAPQGTSPPQQPLTSHCVVIAPKATAIDVLTSAAKALRGKDGKVCAINGYPNTTCGTAVTTSTASGGRRRLLVIGGVVLLALLAAAGGFFFLRRRRAA